MRRWYRSVFTDEKRLRVHGPEGIACFWADKRIARSKLSTQQRGGVGVMVWVGILGSPRPLLCSLKGI